MQTKAMNQECNIYLKWLERDSPERIRIRNFICEISPVHLNSSRLSHWRGVFFVLHALFAGLALKLRPTLLPYFTLGLSLFYHSDQRLALRDNILIQPRRGNDRHPAMRFISCIRVEYTIPL
jgi:hypothetical protein